MASEQFSLCWDNFHKNMSSGMNSLLENEDLVDVTLAVQGKCLKAHKMVLSVCSPYFKELFKSNPCQHPIVFMKDVSYEALSDLLQFMYQGEVQVSQENLTTFIKTAEALQIKGLTGDGNGSTENDTTETAQEKPVHHQIEDYKPPPRPKKQPPPSPGLTSPQTKRSRLSSTSSTNNESLHQPVIPPPITKTEPVSTTPVSNITESAPPVQFKMEPYDQTHSLIDETGDETFGDDTLDDNTVDDTEDYSMMEGGVGEEEPQAGTSTDGAGEGQDLMTEDLIQKIKRKPYMPRYIVDGFVFHVNITKGNPRMLYLRCLEYKRLGCHARAVIPYDGSIQDIKVNKPHNHPPDMAAEEKIIFMRELKEVTMKNAKMPPRKVYETLADMYPNAARETTFESIRHKMNRWRRQLD